MNIDNLIENVYEHICLPKPSEILLFPDIEEAFSDHKNWSRRVEKVMTCFWSYQFPMAIPSSYWASSHLRKDKLRLDVKRSPNENGCFVYGEYINENLSTTLTKEQYESVCVELGQQNYDLTADNVVESILQK